jgi:hypothetical protein
MPEGVLTPPSIFTHDTLDALSKGLSAGVSFPVYAAGFILTVAPNTDNLLLAGTLSQ